MPQEPIPLPDALLVVSRADYRNDDAQHDTQQQRHGGDDQRDADALQILLPAISVDKCLVEFHEGLLPSGQGLAGLHHILPDDIVLR